MKTSKFAWFNIGKWCFSNMEDVIKFVNEFKDAEKLADHRISRIIHYEIIEQEITYNYKKLEYGYFGNEIYKSEKI